MFIHVCVCVCVCVADIFFPDCSRSFFSPCSAERGMKKEEEIREGRVERARCLHFEIHLSKDGFPTETLRLCPPFSPLCVCMCVFVCVCQVESP